jgi:hypothetical protein
MKLLKLSSYSCRFIRAHREYPVAHLPKKDSNERLNYTFPAFVVKRRAAGKWGDAKRSPGGGRKKTPESGVF